MNNHIYVPGDIVRLVQGAKHLKVMQVNDYALQCVDLDTGKYLPFLMATRFVPVRTRHGGGTDTINKLNTEEPMTMKDKLYKTVTDNRYGTGLAIDSDGKFVLKMQDTNTFESFMEGDLKRVMPYTFDVQFVTGRSDVTYSYRGREGQVEVGDILMLTGSSYSIGLVVAINTESEKATKIFDGVKLLTAALT